MKASTPLLVKNDAPQAVVTRILKNILNRIIHEGDLLLILPDGSQLPFGNQGTPVRVQIRDWKTCWQIVLNPDLAIGEAYMDGRLRVLQGNIYDFLDLCLMNLGRGNGIWIRQIQQKIRWLCRRFMMHNPIGKSQKNVAHHYDLSDRLYELFLDPDRQYSCAYYKSADDTLEQAQENKKRLIAAKLLLAPDQKILDIGSGWGGLAFYLAKQAGVNVTGLTLSTEQLRYATRQSEEQKLAERVKFFLRDYRQESGHYDRIVSVGMFEHVGVGNYNRYFAKIASLLTKDGVALVHTIGCANRPSAPQPWIAKYIFPGGYIPSLSEIVPAIERSGLIITDLEVLRLHYAQTLKEWRHRFLKTCIRSPPFMMKDFAECGSFILPPVKPVFGITVWLFFNFSFQRR
ncbi:MAG: cyclopropane-fatty-acyl-phospholipid synthase family protein [Robiginitomaculum sp.]|nr:cyclopropane-fatty-acyl-phospholipid synthase family protein [Robiginitomaculum sp.]